MDYEFEILDDKLKVQLGLDHFDYNIKTYNLIKNTFYLGFEKNLLVKLNIESGER